MASTSISATTAGCVTGTRGTQASRAAVMPSRGSFASTTQLSTQLTSRTIREHVASDCLAPHAVRLSLAVIKALRSQT